MTHLISKILFTPCYYCGLIATSIDHFIPQTLTKRGFLTDEQLLIPACRECNSILGARVFRTLALRREAAKEGIRKKYRKFLNLPDWEIEEIEDLGWTLKSVIKRGQALKHLTRQRLAWRGALNAEVTYKEFGPGNDSAQLRVDNEHTKTAVSKNLSRSTSLSMRPKKEE